PCVGHEDRDGDGDRSDWGTTETSPVLSDTDGDGLCDGLLADATDCFFGEDLDGDGDPADFNAPDKDETDPLNPDTDGGGVNDGDERVAGTNPLDPCDGDLQRCVPDYLQGGACDSSGSAPLGLGALLALALLGLFALRRRRH